MFIPVNPRTKRPVGYAFVDIASCLQAQRATLELSGQYLLERKISVQLARKSSLPVQVDESSPVPGQRIQIQEGEAMGEEATEDKAAVKDESSSEGEADRADKGFHHEVRIMGEKLDTKATPVNWNAANTVKIRTKLGEGRNKYGDNRAVQRGSNTPASQEKGRLNHPMIPCRFELTHVVQSYTDRT